MKNLNFKPYKMNNTEKGLAWALGCLIIVGLGVRFQLFGPNEKIAELESELAMKQSQEATMNALLASEQSIKENWKTTNDRVVELKKHFFEGEEPELVQEWLSERQKGVNVATKALTISDLQGVESIEQINGVDYVRERTLSYELTCNKADVLRYLDKLYSEDKLMMVKSLDFDEKGGTLTVGYFDALSEEELSAIKTSTAETDSEQQNAENSEENTTSDW